MEIDEEGSRERGEKTDTNPVTRSWSRLTLRPTTPVPTAERSPDLRLWSRGLYMCRVTDRRTQDRYTGGPEVPGRRL